MPEVQGVFQRALNLKKPVTGQFYLPYACVSSFVGFPSYCHEVESITEPLFHCDAAGWV